MEKKPIFLFVLVFIVYLFTKANPTPYNYFVRLADAFLHFRLSLLENPPWLNELVPFQGKYYVIYPPMPALVSIPFLILFGPFVDQTLISIFFGSLNAILVYFLVKKFSKEEKIAIWMAIFYCFGTIHWYLATVGSAWYFAHIVANFFLLLALNELFGRKRPFLIGIFLGAAFWSRLPTILSILFFVILLLKENEKIFSKNNFLIAFKFLLGVSIFFVLNFAYNWLRFGTIFDVAYTLRPGIFEEPWFQKGLLSLSYIPEHLKIIFLKGPNILEHFPYFQPSLAGMAIWFTTPAFIFALFYTFWHFREKITFACWLAILPIAILLMSHGGTGFTQFGYRYATDFYPFLFLLTFLEMRNLKPYHKFFIIISILVNLWGVVSINKFGFVDW
jgi:4-amino-4-deoxy-L-arabinose transferase-like glycosyltransferase